MAVMSDRWIRRMAQDHDMITPFVEAQKREGVISYGLSSYGYDARIADEFKIFTNIDSAVIDPKDFSPASFVDRKVDVCIIPPNSFALGHTVEYFRIPRDVLVICLGKSTYARCGIIVNVTPLEPEWEGQVTIEISNTTPLPAKIHAHEGICDPQRQQIGDERHVLAGRRLASKQGLELFQPGRGRIMRRKAGCSPKLIGKRVKGAVLVIR